MDRTDRLRVELMEDSIAFATDSAEKLKGLFVKAKTALSKLYLQVFPKLPQVTGLEALTGAFWVNKDNPIEVLKRNHRILGSTLTFQLLMGYDVDADFETLSKSMPKDEDGGIADLSPFKDSARTCALQLINLVDQEKAKLHEPSAPASSAPASSNKSSKP